MNTVSSNDVEASDDIPRESIRGHDLSSKAYLKISLRDPYGLKRKLGDFVATGRGPERRPVGANACHDGKRVRSGALRWGNGGRRRKPRGHTPQLPPARRT